MGDKIINELGRFVKGRKAPKTAFKKGNTPWNKGIPFLHKGSFQKNHIAWNRGKKCPRPSNEIKKICLYCHRDFFVKYWRTLNGRGNTCSRECRDKYFVGNKATHFGRKHSEETKKKIGMARMGRPSTSWKKGINSKSHGYIFIWKPDHPFKNRLNRVPEHRLVIEKYINRYLTREEVAHHLGEKTDNRPEMLMGFINKSAHLRFHWNPLSVKPEEILFDGRKIDATTK